MTPPRLTLPRLVVAATLLRLVYVLWLCPYTLVEDEAHYWEWSRRLDWSYYSKGPGVAWGIALSTGILGHSTGAVRLPAVIFSGIMAYAVGALAFRVTPDRRASIFAAALVLLIPAFQITAIIMTIDGPFLAFWALACLSAWDALATGRRRHWSMLGAWIALGFTFKYTILLVIPGLVLGAWMTRRTRARASATGVALAAAIAALGLAPIIIWNAPRGWPTVHHMLGHLGLRAGDQPTTPSPYSPMQTLEFIGTQLGVLGPAGALMIAAVVRWVRRPPRPHRGVTNEVGGAPPNQPARFLIACSTPILVFYLAVTFVADAEANWALGGYVGLAAIAGAFVAERGTVPGPQHLWRATLIVGLFLAIVALRADLLARAPGIGRWIPAGRFTAARVMASDAHRRLEDIHARDHTQPLLIAADYGRASQLAFHMPGHPVVYCASGWGGFGRKTQYSYWPDTDLDDPTLIGRSALLVGGDRERWDLAFDRVEDAGQLEGEPKKGRRVYVGVGYRGFGPR